MLHFFATSPGLHISKTPSVVFFASCCQPSSRATKESSWTFDDQARLRLRPVTRIRWRLRPRWRTRSINRSRCRRPTCPSELLQSGLLMRRGSAGDGRSARTKREKKLNSLCPLRAVSGYCNSVPETDLSLGPSMSALCGHLC